MSTDTHERAWEKAKPLTSKSDQSFAARGIIFTAMPDPGCPSRKCLLKGGHTAPCWPKEA